MLLQVLLSRRTFLTRLLLGILALWLVFSLANFDQAIASAAGQDGAVDPTFASGSGFNGIVTNMAVQPDNKIVVAGYFTVYNDIERKSIARLNADGSLDTNFNPAPGDNNDVQTIAVQPDGKILIGGYFFTYVGGIIRLNPNGSLDTSFNPGMGVSGSVNVVAVQSDGKILIGGSFTSYNSVPRGNVARLATTGALDTTFDPGSGTNGSVEALVIQSDGKVLIGGSFNAYNGTGRNRLARLSTTGALDTTFLNTGAGADSIVDDIVVQSDGNILIGGTFTTYNGTIRNSIARLNPNGSLNTDFNPGTGANKSVDIIAVQADGKILIGGSFNTYNGTGRNRLARLSTTGALDTTFLNLGTGANGRVNTVAVQADGKILIGGDFTSYNGTERKYIARLNVDGSLDTSFNPGAGADSSVNAVAVQPDGKILIGGDFTSYNNTTRTRIARLHPNGSLDTTFANSGIGPNNQVYAITLQPNGKILIGGNFLRYNNDILTSGIALLNTDGSLDTNFYTGFGGAEISVSAIALQPDGQILIGGTFTSYNETGRQYFARLNPDGSLDTSSLNTRQGPNSPVSAVAVQADGKVLIGGYFTTYNDAPRNYMVRVNADGSLDTGFLNSGTGFDTYVNAITVQKNGKILVAGSFTSYNGTPRNRIVRLNADGSLDTGFNSGKGSNNDVSAIAMQADGKVIIGGSFWSVDNYTRDSIARLENTVKAESTVKLTSSRNPSLVSENVTFNTTLSPITATGTITFTFGGSTTVTSTLVSGIASYMTNTLPLGKTEVTATYSGDSSIASGSSPVYTQVVSTCYFDKIAIGTDDGAASTCGTFSYAVLNATSGMTITFSVPTVTLSGVLTPTLAAGVVIDGGANGVTLDGGGLVLGGGNKLINLTIKSLSGRGLVVPPDKTGNKLDRVKVTRT
jgi:uncharacterized delta-60 repeat protein